MVLGTNPNLHTVAHEAAHAVQQRACAAHSATSALEDHADRVADRVVAGESAESLLGEVCAPGRAGGGGRSAIQREITFQSKALPPTWRGIKRDQHKLTANTLSIANGVTSAFQARVGAAF